MNCPRCNVTLNVTTIKDVSSSIDVDKCQQCEGIWLDKGELARLGKIVEPTLFEIRKIPPKALQLQGLKCPRCNNHRNMLKADHPRDYNVIMDYCPTCQGIWLDKGELDAIQKENWITVMGAALGWLIGLK